MKREEGEKRWRETGERVPCLRSKEGDWVNEEFT